MPSERLLRTSKLICAAAVVSMLLGPSTASALTTLRWTQPAGSAPVSEFRVFKGPALDVGELVYQGLPTLAAGVYSADVQIDEIDQGLPVFVWLTAVNTYGESPPSNANFYPEGCDPALDADCDGVPDDGAPGGVPCASGQVQGCDDNCPYWPNPGQDDTGGVGVLSVPDGIGDECQCGDVTGNGRITSADQSMFKRWLYDPASLAMPRPDLCDVGGSAGCNVTDLAILIRAVAGYATIHQQCDPALMP